MVDPEGGDSAHLNDAKLDDNYGVYLGPPCNQVCCRYLTQSFSLIAFLFYNLIPKNTSWYKLFELRRPFKDPRPGHGCCFLKYIQRNKDTIKCSALSM